MRPHLSARAVTLALVMTLTSPISSPAWGRDDEVTRPATTAAAVEGAAEELPQAWFVELASPPAVEGTSRIVLARERDGLRSALSRAGIAYRERFAFESAWNGLSVDLSPSSVASVARMNGVRAVYPVVDMPVPTTASVSDPELWTALLQTGADVAQDAGYTGEGVRVAVMDTGIDYDNPDLGGCFGAGCRVVTGHDFVGDLYNAAGATSRQTVPRPDNDPDDCNGHGTHVAGIIGASGDPAQGGARGVAPDVTFGAYRVFGCEGSTSADIMIAAMERALADGMQVLNMSIGSSFQWPTYPTAVAASNLVDAGIVVVASIGNSGSSGVYSTGAPGNGDKVIGVAAFDNTHLAALTFEASPGGAVVPYTVLSSADAPPTSGESAEIVYVGRGCVAGTGVPAGGDPYLANPAGKVALIERGVCSFNEKYARAFNAGAVGVIVHNNAAGIFLGGSVTNLGIFGIAISQADGLLLRGLTPPVKANWKDERVSTPLPTGGLISSFSSYGLVPDLGLKPDIGAPGGYIYSTYPLELGGHAVVSGTSMSSPHVAGAVAALLQAHPGTAAGDVRTILQNSADPHVWWANPGSGLLDNVHRQGAGMLDIPGAIGATTRVTPSKLALGESVPTASQTKRLTIANQSQTANTYTFTHESAVATTGGTYSPGFSGAAATVSFSAPSLALAPGTSGTVDVTITAPAGTSNLQYGGYLKVVGGGQTFRVPYAGFRGDYQTIATLVPTSLGFPWLAKRTGVNVDPNTPIKDYAKQAAGATYTFKTKTLDDVPYALFHLDQQVSRLTIDVYEAGATSAWGRVLDLTNYGRSSTSTAFYSLAWDGTAADMNGPNRRVVKDGSYFFKITVLRALGDPNNPAHSESWTSPVFNVLREGDETAPTSIDARISTSAAPAAVLGTGDAFKVVFSELMLAPTPGTTITVRDADGTQADVVCATNATCELNSTETTVGGTTYPSGQVLTVSITAAIAGTGGTVAGVGLPATVIASGITDRSLNAWDLAGSTDVVIDSE